MPGRLPDAIAAFQAALRIKPEDAETHFALGTALARTPGGLPEAIAELETTLRIRPDFEPAQEAILRLRGMQAKERAR
jgi:tetratricopeptide (TPR) repeat protein